jgi:transposase
LCGGVVTDSAHSKQEVIPMKKRTYRAQEINKACVARIVKDREGCAATVGIDVGKDDLFLVVRWPDGMWSGPWHARNTSEIRAVVELLVNVARGRRLVVALEPTGTYGDALRYALTQAGLTVHRVQGKAAHDYAEVFDGVPSQHDRKDAAIVAELAALGKSSPWPYEEPRELDEELRYWVNHLDAAEQSLQVWTGRLEGLLARHWPELAELLELSSMCLLKMLVEYGGPAGVAADPMAGERLAEWGRAFLSEEKREAVLESARETVGVPQSKPEKQWVQDCAKELLELQRKKKEVNGILKRWVEKTPVLRRMAEAVGMGAACVLWVRLGNPQDYHCGEAYRKAMGLNVKERSSGRYKGQLKLTKRGPACVRRWMYLAALRLTQELEVQVWYGKKKARDGGRSGKALVAVMRKLALALYRVAVDDVAFDPAKLFPGAPLPKAGVSARARQKGPPLRASAVTSTH